MGGAGKSVSRKICGYNMLSVIVALASVISVDILLFMSLNYKTKYRMYRVQGLVLIEILLYYISRFSWRRIQPLCSEKPLASKPWKLGLLVFFFLAHLGPFFTFYNSRNPSTLGIMTWACSGAELILCFVLVVFEVALVLLSCIKCNDSGLAKFCRSKAKGWLCFIFSILYLSTAYLNATSLPVILRQEIPIAKLPRSMDGLKIALLADIHLGPTVGFDMMDGAVKIANSLKPDIVVLAGDLTDGTVEELKEAALPLKDIVAPYGSFFVTGNHEYYTSDVDEWMKFVESIGFHVLHNSNVKVHSKTKPAEWICIFGTDDRQTEIFSYEGHSVNLTKAFSGCDGDHSAIFITHQPNIAMRALKMGYPIQLTLSGHTHAGQLFPFSIPVYFANAFFAGLYKYDEDSYVYVTQGTYYYGWPLRSASHNEITEITLRSV